MSSVHSIKFQSYGVRVEIAGNDRSLLDEAAETAKRSLLGNFKLASGGRPDQHFEMTVSPGGRYFRVAKNGVEIAGGRSRVKFVKFFDTLVRVSVGEAAPEHVFLHAGVVGWRGKAIVMPADSFQGKSTLVTELVRAGAEYYSDDFAILDAAGLVHPFARRISMRGTDEKGGMTVYDHSAEELGGVAGSKPIRVGAIIFTKYEEGAAWRPKTLTAGEGAMQALPFTLSLHTRPEFSLRVLNLAAGSAIIASSLRGNAENFARTLLNFVDKRGD
jgi:hypothetical protein